MPSINVNMYISMVEPPVPQFILGDSAFASDNTVLPNGVQILSTSSGSIPANNNLQNPYYFNENGSLIGGQYNYIFVPVGYHVDLTNVYVYNQMTNQWNPFSETSTWFHQLNVTPIDSNNNQYIVYQFYHYIYDDDDYESIRTRFSFNIIS